MSDEIDIVVLIDGTIRDCVGAGLPPYPAIIASAFSDVLAAGSGPTERCICFAQLFEIVKQRIQFFATNGDVVN